VTRLNVGLLGCGVVGSAVARRLVTGDLGTRVGTPVALARVAVRDVAKPRAVTLPDGALTGNAHCVATDLGVDVVVEAIGGTSPARELVRAALESGKHVVTANKQLLAAYGDELDAVAAANGVSLHSEASVCGAVPIVRVLRRSLAGDRVRRIDGIVNGTTNYVLSTMAERGCTLAEAVADAQRLGYAESDPADDLTGRDAAAKAVLLARLAFGVPVSLGDVTYEGIEGVTRDDVCDADGVLKLVASVARTDGGVRIEVGPKVLGRNDLLAGVDGVDNAVVVDTECAGRLFLRGPGAGGESTATAVLGDLVTALRRLKDDAL
jgi:homoserine dehydrogenase